MKAIICGGGTGGHIYPGLSIADIIKEKDKGADILFVGTVSGLESILVPGRGYNFQAVRVKGFKRKLSAETLKTMVELAKGLTDAARILKEYKPDIVIGTGGYVAGPILLIAALKGIPTLIHEQNVLPGVTNRILGRFVDRVAVSFDEARKYFKNGTKIVVTGNPVRKEILGRNKELSMKNLGFKPGIPLVLVFGGSKGSARLNTAVLDLISRLRADYRIQLLHVTGEVHYKAFMEELDKRGVTDKGLWNIKIIPYLHQMPDALAAADVAVTSSGAITLAELTAVGVPAILVPKSHATDNHQEYNARALERRGAALVILESELNGESLYTRINTLINDNTALERMRTASKKLGKTDAADKIYDEITRLLTL